MGGRKTLFGKGGFKAWTGAGLLAIEVLGPGVVMVLDIPILKGRGSGTRGRRSGIFLALSWGFLDGGVGRPVLVLLILGGCAAVGCGGSIGKWVKVNE